MVSIPKQLNRRKLGTAHWPLATDFSNLGNLRQGLPVWYKNQQYPIL